ncbi:MAG: radical SAM protein [Pseudobutyrivibrio ruminis]|nr:radical SAM protein [Pseudobutyrivibrio ruminis]
MIRNDFENYEKQFYMSKDWVVPYSQIPKGSNIVLYGAGDVGQAYYMQLMYTEYCNIVAWVDQKAEMYNSWGLEVVPINAIKEYQYDYVLIAVADMLTAKSINKLLLSMNVKQGKILWLGYKRETIRTTTKQHYLLDAVGEEVERYCHINEIEKESSSYHEYYAKILADIEDDSKIVIPRVVVQLTQKCTLKCKGCNNLMPKFTAPKHFNKSRIIKDINSLSDKVDRIMVMELLGGEPFLYPDLVTILEQLRKMAKIDRIELTTNGTIVPSERVLEQLKKNKVLVRVSKYPKSTRLNELINRLKNNEIKFEILDELIWHDSNDTMARQMTPYEELMTNYKCASPKVCKTLSNGKLYLCARAAALYDLGICKDENNFVDITLCDREKLKSFSLFPRGTVCNYCTCTDNWREIDAGLQ